jgi:hypothetical protein
MREEVWKWRVRRDEDGDLGRERKREKDKARRESEESRERGGYTFVKQKEGCGRRGRREVRVQRRVAKNKKVERRKGQTDKSRKTRSTK